MISRHFLVFLLCSALATLADPRPARAADRPTVEQVRAGIKSMYARLDSLLVKVSIVNTPLSKVEPGFVAGYSTALRDEFAVAGDRRYRCMRGWVPQPGRPTTWREARLAYDGKVTTEMLFECTPPEQPNCVNSSVSTGPSTQKLEQMNLYLEAIGSPFYEGEYIECQMMRDLGMPNGTTLPLIPFSLDPALASGKYAVREAPETVRGVACVVVEYPGQDMLWLDPARSFVVLRRDWHYRPGQRLLARYDNSDFKEVKPGVWLPLKARRELMAPPTLDAKFADTALVRNECDVTDLIADAVSDSQFRLDFPPGTRVLDFSRIKMGDGASVMVPYTVGANAELTQRALDDAAEAVEVSQRGGRRVDLLIWLQIAFALGLFGYFLYRRFGRAGPSPAAPEAA